MCRHQADVAATVNEGSGDLCADGMTGRVMCTVASSPITKHDCLQISCICMVHISKKQLTNPMYKSRNILEPSEDGGG